MSSQSEKYNMSLAGEFFVAAQLQRLGINASITYGNAKGADVIAISQKTGKAITIEVKTSKKKRWPVGNRVPASSNKPWVFVHLPEDPEEGPDFYILLQKDIHKALSFIEKSYMESYKKKHGEEYGTRRGVAALNQEQAIKFKNKWDKIISQITP